MGIDKVAEALEQYVNSQDWDEARQIVDRNKELLGDEARALLAESVVDYQEAGRDDLANYLEQHLKVLDRAREAGVDQAFNEASARAEQVQQVRRTQLDSLRPKGPSGVQAAVWQLLDAGSPEEVDRILEGHPELSQKQDGLNYLDELIKQARDKGQNEALSLMQEYHELLQSLYELPPLMRALQEFMAVPTWSEARDVLKKHPELMGDEAPRVMDSLIGEARKQGDENTANALETYRRVLQRAREIGPEQAIEEASMTEPEPASR